MILEMLVIEPDGSQHFESVEVADNWFTDGAEKEAQKENQ